LALARSKRPNLVLLSDIGLPGIDGLDAMLVFQKQLDLPVILLTARRQVQDETLGLRLGADDYVVKPFSLEVLVARIRSVLRRSGHSPSPTLATITVGALTIDPGSRTAIAGAHVLKLPPRVFDLLYALASEAGRVVPIERLVQDVWGLRYEGEPQVVYVHIRWLREPAH
jgi:DNA-binding response OmpR family regulator